MLDFLTDILTRQKIGKVYLKEVKINKLMIALKKQRLLISRKRENSNFEKCA